MSFNTSPCLVALALLAAQPAPAAETLQQWAEEVRVTEQAFADTMARRGFADFQSFRAEETVCASGPAPLRGQAAVLKAWSRFCKAPTAPFSW